MLRIFTRCVEGKRFLALGVASNHSVLLETQIIRGYVGSGLPASHVRVQGVQLLLEDLEA